MRKTTRSLPIAASTLISILVLPGTALAQRQLDPVRVTAAATERADSLYAKAERQEIQSKSQFAKTAALYERSAELRSPGDDKRFESLVMAARLRYGHGDRRRAADDMEQAAEEAAIRGDVVNAAVSYLDAAFLAVELRQRDRAVKHVRAARLLTHSPLLTDAQRLELRVRLPQRAEVAILDVP